MSSSLDMSLDDIIHRCRGYRGGERNNNHFRGRDRGGASRSGSAPGPNRRFFQRDAIRHRPYPMLPPMVVPEPIMLPSGEANGESGTKLYISELDYGVSNDDIKLLFSDVGELKRYSIHYDKSGRSKGTAEVVFSRQTDALAAIERYNNVQLDGKPMKIELVGVNLFAPPMPVTASSNMGKSHGAFRSERPHAITPPHEVGSTSEYISLVGKGEKGLNNQVIKEAIELGDGDVVVFVVEDMPGSKGKRDAMVRS
ncbi:hypothetical protein P3X46_014222 [Hevea brasiliensis]|uniref:RRM domain-containing protein n=1 Tax=Hevea brasiliensis TaxID=3981 RepID=A0ABQ9M9N4_HEVBR|nr:THO complex subunit 4B isoform X1 [Hevea brasiliensis]KAJ9175690.1 hypothetical protein P3X46_014222 [Hevea brasiliensis]